MALVRFRPWTSGVAGLALLAGCGPRAYDTTPPSSFLLTCARPGATTMVLRIDTGVRRFTVVNADGAPGGAVTATPYAYALTAADWTGKVGRYDGQLIITRSPPRSNALTPPNKAATAPAELWTCASSADKAKF